MAERHRRWIRCAALLLCAVGAIAGPASARAEDAPAPEERLTRAQLKELVGPVALYPDGVLASLLPATTFPLDVIAAARWVEEKGGKVEAVPEDRGWDASVIALLQFPDVLTWLNENLAWMDQMGRAVAAQQAEVLQAIQDFRREVQAAGNLPEGEHLVVKEEQAQGAPEGTTVIVIEPANPQVVYVPIYDPVYVIRPAYPGPLYGFSLGFGFGAASFWGWYDLSWGWWNPWNNFGWYGGIYYSPYVRYWGQPRPYGSWSGPDRPRHWTSQYYPPRHDGHHASIARPTTVRPVYDETRRGAARTGVRPPTRTRLDGGLRTTTPSPVRTTRSAAPTLTTGTPSTGASPRSGVLTTRRAWTDRTITRPNRATAPGLDASSVRGRTSLERRTTPAVRTTPRTTRSSTGAVSIPRARPTPSISSSSQPLISRQPATQTRNWSSRGHGSLRRSTPNATPRATPEATPRATPGGSPRRR